MSEEPLLQVEDLRVAIRQDRRTSHPVDGVSFRLLRRRTVGLVGESGCGKSMTALSILRLVPSPPASIVGGAIRFRGRDLLELSESQMRAVRGNDIAMVFQEPMTSLNPVYTCGEQIAEVLRLHLGLSRPAARGRAVELLRQVQIADPEQRADAYPHQLSGGMRQRVMIAMAIACAPDLLIADEPTTALDVTIQSQILELLRHLQGDLGMSVLHITHDLALVAESAHEVLVMYAGKVVEVAPAARIFDHPSHPYTLGLLASRPELGARRRRLPTIGGQVPDPGDLPTGCRFRQRCPFAVPRCTVEEPPLLEVDAEHASRCWEAEAVGRVGRWPLEG
jgi:peptide/nickel transport system ATP-binding protein